jgi:O-antigen/teichoic acid export membrane protein
MFSPQSINLKNLFSISLGKKVFFSFLDQGLFSGANFVLNILLARWLTEDGYGAFSVAFSVFLLLAGVQTSLILEPMVIYGSVNHLKHLREYLGEISLYQFVLNASFSSLLIIIGSYFDPAVHASFMGLAFSMPFTLLFWLMRQACYIESRTDLAAKGSSLYAFTLVIGTFLVFQIGYLTTSTAFLLMGGCGGIASFFLWHKLNVKINLKFNSSVIRENWTYGKWILIASISSWVIVWIYPPVISTFASLSQAGSFRAIQNFILPLQQSITAISLFLLPLLSRQIREQGILFIDHKIKLISAVGILIAVIYTILLIVIAPILVKFLYLAQNYNESIWLVPYLGLSVIIYVPGQFMGLTFRAMGQSANIFWSKAISAFIILTVGMSAIILYGLMGVAYCLILGSLVDTGACLFIYAKNLHNAHLNKDFQYRNS